MAGKAPKKKAGRKSSSKGRSAGLSAAAFLGLAPADRVRPVVALVGDEGFFKREAVKAIAEALPAAERIDVAYQRSTETRTVLDELRSASLFSSEKLVVVTNAEGFVEATRDQLEDFVGAAPKGRVLALNLGKLDSRTRFAKAVKKAGHIVTCKKLYAENGPWERGPRWDTELARYAADRFRKREVTISTELAYHLTKVTGNDLFEIDQTLEKLSLLVGPGGVVGEEQIEALAAHTRRDNAFAIAEAVGMRDAPRALMLVDAAFKQGLQTRDQKVTQRSGIGVILLGTLVRTFREIHRVSAYLAAGGATDRRTIASKLGIAPFAVSRVMDQARAYRGADLEACFRALLRADLAMKGIMGPEVALTRLIGEVAPMAAGARRA
ncbi:MAG: DNA polymerase III subunit delta [Planctomycetota bacterium]|jgi:DNA polymerase-3 subunit delta